MTKCPLQYFASKFAIRYHISAAKDMLLFVFNLHEKECEILQVFAFMMLYTWRENDAEI